MLFSLIILVGCASRTQDTLFAEIHEKMGIFCMNNGTGVRETTSNRDSVTNNGIGVLLVEHSFCNFITFIRKPVLFAY